jgi:hypothetical protein
MDVMRGKYIFVLLHSVRLKVPGSQSHDCRYHHVKALTINNSLRHRLLL